LNIGCGAFCHDPQIESQLWKQVIDIYGSYFTEIIFAIMDRPNGRNITAFQSTFQT
jgi:hypothetical protein